MHFQLIAKAMARTRRSRCGGLDSDNPPGRHDGWQSPRSRRSTSSEAGLDAPPRVQRCGWHMSSGSGRASERAQGGGGGGGKASIRKCITITRAACGYPKCGRQQKTEAAVATSSQNASESVQAPRRPVNGAKRRRRCPQCLQDSKGAERLGRMIGDDEVRGSAHHSAPVFPPPR